MNTYIALLRAINLAGHRQVAMTDLRDLVTQAGFADARSLLQSGNLIFRSNARKTADLERTLETAARKHFDLEIDFFVRTMDEWLKLIAENPFRPEATRDPAHLLVMFLKEAPGPDRVEALQAAIFGPETVSAKGRHAYFVYPNGIGRSRVTNALIEKKLETRGTGRNWNTVLKLGALGKL
jgi:uncharacterized protein (DUF1697 family)